MRVDQDARSYRHRFGKGEAKGKTVKRSSLLRLTVK